MSKVLNKGALFTDIHFGKRNNSEEHNQDCINFIDWFITKVKSDPEIDHIYFLDDWHEHRSAINGLTLKYSYEAAKKLNELGLPIFFIVGNHDLYFRNNRNVFTTNIFEAFENFVLIDRITKLDNVHGGAIVVPYLNEDEYPELVEYKDVPVALGHFELQGFVVTGDSRVMEHGPDYKTFFKKQKRVFSGHFHKRQNQGNVYYIGNTFPMDFSDTNDTKRGMAIYDFTTDNLKYIDWEDGPRFIKATLTEVLANPKKILVKGARVKIDVDDDITYEESNQIKQSLAAKYDLREIMLSEQMTLEVNLSENEEDIEELKLETTNEVIQELLRRIKDDSVDTDLLLKIYNSIKLSSTDDLSKASHVEFMELTMRNFLSYGNGTTSVNLNFSNPTMVMGRNYDSVVEGQVDSNGSGKSTILNALLLCLFGQNLMKAKLDKQINKSNGKNMMLTVTFKADGKYYKVERYRKNKEVGGDGVRLYINPDEPVFTKDHDKTPDSVANCEAAIERIIGIPYEMFIRIVVFSATHEPFLSLPSSHASQANQKDIIEELFGLTELTQKAEKLKEMLSASKSEFKNLVEVDERVRAEHQRHAIQIDANVSRQNEWDVTRSQRLLDIQNQITELEKIDIQNAIDGFEEIEKLTKELTKVDKNIPVLESELKNIRSQAVKFEEWESRRDSSLATISEKLKELRKIDIDALRVLREEQLTLEAELQLKFSGLKLLRNQLSTSEANVEQKVSYHKKLTQEIEHLNDNTCPYCKQTFTDAKAKIKSNQKEIKEIDEFISATTIENDEFKKSIEEIQNRILEIQNRLKELASLVTHTNLDEIKVERDNLERSLEEQKNQTNPYVADEDALDEESVQETLAELNKKQDAIKNKIGMAREFIHSSFKSMSDVEGHRIKINSLKSRIEEINSEENPFVSVVKSLQDVTLDALQTDRINNLDKQIKHQDFLVKLLTKKDSFIRKALLNKCLPLLNTRLRYYLDRVGLPHKVNFNEEMGVDISQFGSEWEYGLFSSGQKARVNICLAFAFRDVLQSRFGKTNLCILDECLDTGLGAVGVGLVAKMIKSVAVENKLSMFVISHRDEISNMFDKRLEIELRNGFSTILEQV